MEIGTVDSRLENRSADSVNMVPNRNPPALSQTEKGRVSGMKNSDRNALYLLKLQLTNHCIAPTPKENPRDSVLLEKLRNLMTFELPN